MIINVEKSKFQKAVEEQLRLAMEREKIYPITYSCTRCKDKKWHIWWENGYEYAEPCDCQIREWEERAKEYQQ